MSLEFRATLVGEIDGLHLSGEFDDHSRAMQWLLHDGLAAEFPDQTARGELWQNGKLIWIKQGLQTPEHAKHEAARQALRFVAELDNRPKKP